MTATLLGLALKAGLPAQSPPPAAPSPVPAAVPPGLPATPTAPAPPEGQPPPAASPLPVPAISLTPETPAAIPPPPAPVISTRRRLSPLAEAPDWPLLASYEGVLTRAEFEKAFASVYGDGSAFPVPWKVEAEALVVETSPGKEPARIKFRDPAKPAAGRVGYWRRPEELPPLKRGEPILKGVHIALDPGHIGGAYAQLEERWLSMNAGEEVLEGRLVLQVAQILKPRLEGLGAQVSLVRSNEAPVTTDTPASLKAPAMEILREAGIINPQETYTNPRDDLRVATVQYQAEKLFYRTSEIRARAKRVNVDLKPDVVVCLHLNAEPWGNPQQPAFVDRNHFHLLINGCYSPEELQLEDVRFEMLQRLFSGIHVQELAMSTPAAAAMAAATSLPPYIYTKRNARRVSSSPYVYARNLLANRLYLCPVLYMEPYVMNHGETYKRLLLGHYLGRTLLDGKLVSSPVEDYVRGVERGLVEYYGRTRRKEVQ